MPVGLWIFAVSGWIMPFSREDGRKAAIFLLFIQISWNNWRKAALMVMLRWFAEYLGLAVVFAWNSVLQEKFYFCFSRVFTSIGEFSFWQGGWVMGYHSMGFRHFPDVL